MGYAEKNQDKDLVLMYAHKRNTNGLELKEIRKHNGISIYKDFFSVENKIGKKEYEYGYAEGGDVVSIKKKRYGIKEKRYGGGLRGLVWWQSRQSKKRMLRTLKMLNQAKIDESRILFITLTHDEDNEKRSNITGQEHQRQLKEFCRWMQKKYGGFAAWKFELGVKRFEKTGKWIGHWHLIWFEVSFVEIQELCDKWNDITKGSVMHRKIGVDVVKARDWKNTLHYANKLIGYMAKSQESYIDEAKEYCKKMGIKRVWGTINKSRLNECIDWVKGTITQKVFHQAFRIAKKLYMSWMKKKGNIKGIRKMKKWQQMWDRRINMTLEWFMDNKQFIKLLEWCGADIKRTQENDRVRNLDDWQLVS